MAKATVCCICPNCKAEFYWEKYKPSRKDADEWEEYVLDGQDMVTNRLCGECFLAKKKAEQKALADEVDVKYKLPQLSGTEKQIEWARGIRAEYCMNRHADMEIWLKVKTAGYSKDEEIRAKEERMMRDIARDLNITSSATWIWNYKCNNPWRYGVMSTPAFKDDEDNNI